ncbi:hypothetical protein [Roseibium alexandrii]|uniref:hypothetical protein n=1 Tax=Roseibium alexandrii TaxID=388408 RepID=UPI0037500566
MDTQEMTKTEMIGAAKELNCEMMLEALCQNQFGHTSIEALSDPDFKAFAVSARPMLMQVAVQDRIRK